MSLPRWLTRNSDGSLSLRIHAQPGAKRNRVAGIHGEALKIQLQAPAVEGRANQALLSFLAETLGCRKNQLTIVRGETSREKVVRLTGLTLETTLQYLSH